MEERVEERSEERPIGIIGAMDVEIETILKSAEVFAEEDRAGIRFYLGALSGVNFVLAKCCEGKVNSALCAQVMADGYVPKIILNIGVAGGLGPQVHIGDVVIATSCVQYDFDGTALGAPLGQMSVPGQEKPVLRFPCDTELSEKLTREAEKFFPGTIHSGVIATGDRFVADPAFSDHLHKTFGALACEMEGASIAHACLMNHIPCVILRSISDNANDSDTTDFRTFAADSAAKAQKLLAEVITSL